jgi:Fe-S-cluster-containing dehydrogenase component
MVSEEFGFFIDPQRCIGCRSCVGACAECGTHRGRSMIHLDEMDRLESAQTVPTVCMHCEDPICAQVCPSDAIKRSEDGVVHAAQKPRCIGCQNCELSCPFGVPIVFSGLEQMLKCDLCYDRTSVGHKPMCATVCPSQALLFVRKDEVASMRHNKPLRDFLIGSVRVKTRNAVMVPDPDAPLHLDAALLIGGSISVGLGEQEHASRAIDGGGL